MQETRVNKSHIEKTSTTRKISIPTLIEEVKPVVLVQQSRKIRTTKFSSQFLEYQDSDAMERSNDFYVENSSTGAVFSIENLMEELRFRSLNVDRNQNKWYFWKNWRSRTDQNNHFVHWVIFRQRKVSDGDLGWRNFTCSYWEIWICISRHINCY